MLSTEIRRAFIKYFTQKNHRHLPSSSTIPHDDPTLMFTNAGMNQFKDYFLGQEVPISPTAVTSQKCIRVGGKHNDLENVGHTKRHLTFFEMMGNFSFGDYFKKEAIEFAWDVTTQIFQFDIDKLWITVYQDDDEAFELWKKFMPEKRIIRIDTADNFWSMGDVGLCGPCTELFYDKGSKYGSATSPANDTVGDRFFEFWNLVFMQYNRSKDQVLMPIPKPCVDTGSGLERVVSLKMGVDNVFETDLLRSLIDQTEAVLDVKYDNQNNEHKAAFHVIVDHLRSLSFAIADGAQPSNLDRGYILRKVLRRAVRYGRMLGAQKPFLAKVFPRLLELMHEDFPELKSAKSRIEEILIIEEESFIQTLKRGGNLLNQIIKSAKESKSHQISGSDAFLLKDTYGLPIDEITLLAKDSHLDVDIKTFLEHEKKAKEISKAVHKNVDQQASESIYKKFVEENSESEFCGYKHTLTKTKVLALIQNGKFVNEVLEGEKAEVILEKTPFYAEMGGQVGDQGDITTLQTTFKVVGTKSPYTNVVSHFGKCLKGTLKIGDNVEAEIDKKNRALIAKNHSATHLLHWALEKVLGDHIRQAGSLVESNRMRFDFSHHKALTQDHLHQIEDLINAKIKENFEVKNYELDYKDVQARSDIKQFFGDKYGLKVRVVDMEFSKELCGGTHTARTGDIGLFKITKESSIAAGVRRIEAVSGVDAENYVRGHENLLSDLSNELKTTPLKLYDKLLQHLMDHKNLVEHNKSLAKVRNSAMIDQLIEKKQMLKDTSFIAGVIDLPKKELREFVLELNQKAPKSICLIAHKEENQVALLIKVSDEIKISAKEILDACREPINARGGGKDGFAQAGGENPQNISQVFELAKEFLKNRV